MRNQITRITTLGVLAGATTLMPVAADAQQDRVSATEKGSCLIFSKVEIRWDSTGALIQDTFIDITNDFGEDVRVQMYFINGDAPLDEYEDERAHPGWNHVSVEIMLTKNQPTYWSAFSGGGGTGVAPFPVLDPDPTGTQPGRPDPDGSSDRVLRGYILAWAVDANNEEIRWNHLKGDAILINYMKEYAWEYNAWAFQVVSAAENGDPTGDADAGWLKMDGVEYAPGFDVLILDFYAEGSAPFFYGGTALGMIGNGESPTVSTDLTTHPIDVDLRQEDEGPVTTKLKIDVWNEDEVKFNGLERCITCWDQVLLTNFSGFGIPNNFLFTTLGTNKGKARIDGVRSDNCDLDFVFDPEVPFGDDPRDIVSQDASILGLAAKFLDFTPTGATGTAAAGTNLIGAGTQNASILYDALDGPPEVAGPEQDANNGGGVSVDGFDSALDAVRDGIRAARRR